MATTVQPPQGAISKFSSAQNNIFEVDRVAHDWYRFVLSFPPHLVRKYIEKFGICAGNTVLDPFCGTGTTVVECKKLGVNSLGVEAHPMAAFASRVKLDWTPPSAGLIEHASRVAKLALKELHRDGVSDEPNSSRPSRRLRGVSDVAQKLLLTDSISPLPLHKVLVLLEVIERLEDARFTSHEKLALAKIAVNTASNLRFGPEVGLGVIKHDSAVVEPWFKQVRLIAEDLEKLSTNAGAYADVHKTDSRILARFKRLPIDAVITSPPYPNEKDYTRTTRLETVLLGFVGDKESLRELKRTLIRSNTRGVYKPDDDDRWVATHPEINRIAKEIEARRIALKKDSGFERLYARVTKLYFGGMTRHFSSLRNVLAPGAKLAYVVGDQASYLRVLIRTGQLLGEIAESLGYRVDSLELFRTRIATATKEQMREEVLLLTWLGTQQNQKNGSRTKSRKVESLQATT